MKNKCTGERDSYIFVITFCLALVTFCLALITFCLALLFMKCCYVPVVVNNVKIFSLNSNQVRQLCIK